MRMPRLLSTFCASAVCFTRERIRKHTTISSCLFSLMLLVVPYTELQASVIYTATLSGTAESPPNASTGTGFATVEYDSTAHTLMIDMSFSGLIGTTTAAHIHCCTAAPLAGTAGVATTTPSFPNFPLGVTSGSYKQTFDLTQASSYNPAFITANGGTTAGAEAVLAAGLANGETYFNIHTNSIPSGEIRGFLTSVPLPAAVWLFGSGLLGLIGIARPKKTI
jgi:hypothetical protein